MLDIEIVGAINRVERIGAEVSVMTLPLVGPE